MGEHISVETTTLLLGMVTAITEGVKRYIPNMSDASKSTWAPMMAAIVSLIVLLVWAVSNEPSYDRTLLFPYLAVFISLWTGAMGTHSVITHVSNRMRAPGPDGVLGTSDDIDVP